MPSPKVTYKNQIRVLLAIATYYVVIGQLSPVIVNSETQNILGYLTIALLAVAVVVVFSIALTFLKGRRFNSP